MSKRIAVLKGWVLAMIEGIRYYFCIVKRGWWKRWPFLPLTTKRYIKFRLDTAYGMPENGWKRPHWTKIVADTRSFLLWRRELRIETKRRHEMRMMQRGFTLIEVMIAIAVICIIAALIGTCVTSGGKDNKNCSWWPSYDLCVCKVGFGYSQWGFVAPPRVCDREME
jgi:prepilin-type N-terminal cleavage/methylation domain-containing protein